jgi:hypothetical protein
MSGNNTHAHLSYESNIDSLPAQFATNFLTLNHSTKVRRR